MTMDEWRKKSTQFHKSMPYLGLDHWMFHPDAEFWEWGKPNPDWRVVWWRKKEMAGRLSVERVGS